MATPSKEPPRTATWEIVCRDLYARNEKWEKLGHAPLAHRAIDEIFLVCAMLRILFETDKDYVNLRDKLRSAGFSDNLVAMPVLRPTWGNIILAHQKAKMVFKDDYYDDEDENPSCIHDHGKKKRVHADFITLLEFTGVTIKNHIFPRPTVMKEPNTIYYTTGLLPHDLSPYLRDDAITEIPPLVEKAIKADDHESKNRSLEQHQEQPANPRINLGSGAAVKSTLQDNLGFDCNTILYSPSDASPHRKGARTPCLRMPSWEFICLCLYDDNSKREILGHPPFTRQDIDQIFLYRALLNTLFWTWDDCHDLQQRLRSAGFSDDWTAVKGLQHKKVNGVDTFAKPEPQTSVQHSCNNKNIDKNRRKLYEITQASMDARLKRKRASAAAQLAIQNNYFLYYTIHNPTVLVCPATNKSHSGSIARQRKTHDKRRAASKKYGNGKKSCKSKLNQSYVVDSSQRKDAPIANTIPNNVDKAASPDRNANESRWKPTKANIQFGFWFGTSLPSNNRDEGKLSCAATFAEQTVKVPHHLRYQYKKKLWIVIATLAALLAVHVLFWNRFGKTDHRLRGQRNNPRLWVFLSMETGGHPRIHLLGKDHGTFSDPNHPLHSRRRA